MKSHLLLLALVCACVPAMHAAEISPGEVKLVSATAVQWLVFDEWGKARPDEPYSKNDGLALQRLRERLQSYRHNPPVVVAYLARDREAFTARYSLQKRTLQTGKNLRSDVLGVPYIVIHLDPTSSGPWDVSISGGPISANLTISHGEHGYCVDACRGLKVIPPDPILPRPF